MTSGYIDEIFSSFQGEGAAIEGSCYGLRQIFIRFSGCPLALGVHNTKGCVWCDSPRAKNMKNKFAFIEKTPGSQEFEKIRNPLTIENLMKIVAKLQTPDLHSVSLTGGEPLAQPEFLYELIISLKKRNLSTYLETAWTDDFDYLEKISEYIDYACVDIKDRSANAALPWETLIEEEIQMCKALMKNNKTKVFGKIVVTKSTKSDDVSYIAEKCGKNNIPIVIQVMSPVKHIDLEPPTWKQIQEFTRIAAEHLPPSKVGLSVQAHKLINIL